ncbi:TatD family hydrolase, partial [Vibrio sp. FNV 38]|nr:TatD family hydrolase [Vibrio sp. FNV 38]
MRDLVGERDNVVFSCGVHPLNQNDPYDVEDLRRLAAEEGVVALGETGLDYYYTPETKVRQQESFIHHIQIGRELNKPVIVHTRDARADTLAILREEDFVAEREASERRQQEMEAADTEPFAVWLEKHA